MQRISDFIYSIGNLSSLPVASFDPHGGVKPWSKDQKESKKNDSQAEKLSKE